MITFIMDYYPTQLQRSWTDEDDLFLQMDQNMNFKGSSLFNSRTVTGVTPCSCSGYKRKQIKERNFWQKSQWWIATELPWTLVCRFDLSVFRLFIFHCLEPCWHLLVYRASCLLLHDKIKRNISAFSVKYRYKLYEGHLWEVK